MRKRKQGRDGFVGCLADVRVPVVMVLNIDSEVFHRVDHLERQLVDKVGGLYGVLLVSNVHNMAFGWVKFHQPILFLSL